VLLECNLFPLWLHGNEPRHASNAMRSTQHPSNNDVLRAPGGSTVDECRPLAVTRVHYPDGTRGVWSFWRPTDAERAAIAEGALIQLCAIGSTHPPIAVMVDGVDDTGFKP
jgi:hypothetical protein